MKWLALVILMSGLFILTPNVFAENLFYGISSFEKLPSVISNEPSSFELKIRYTEGPDFMIKRLTPIFDISPPNAKSYVQMDVNSLDGLYRNGVGRIQGTMSIDPQIPYKKVFVSVYFNGTDEFGNTYKSAWTDSVTFNIQQGGSVDMTQKCKESILGAKYGKPVDLEYEINGGRVISNCKLEDQNSIVTKIDAEKDGQIIIKIPKKLVYSISGKNCEDGDLIILRDGEEALPLSVTNSQKDNVVTVEFPKGIHTIEIIGTLIPDPAPSRYAVS